ncbi:Der GTPase-activating protein YihI [Martelella alba]|uniref:Der GTPase-activating protein YihI n=1 Tax=Martelella alba TaxID=2590451 RepID=A0ABY2SH04_9HYPH|nr:Der GTPase-activating protein YihI [Martelella alba]TKI04262.1 Der GTPase-activating protein YihI [Martelella alba]
MKPTTHSGRTQTAARKKNRKSREQLNEEGRDRKRSKKHRGLAAGSRNQESKDGNGNRSMRAVAADPRIGSKKPVPLSVPGAVSRPASSRAVVPPVPLAPEEELDSLENDIRLDALLTRIEQDDDLSTEEQAYVDEKLDRIDQLMALLGIELDEDEEDAPQDEDMLQLLKRGFGKDGL